jgi:hypothetical protein
MSHEVITQTQYHLIKYTLCTIHELSERIVYGTRRVYTLAERVVRVQNLPFILSVTNKSLCMY